MVWQKRILIILLCFSMITFFHLGLQEKRVLSCDKNLIRLHVIANSDSAEDQNLKRDVRDEIISELGPEFRNTADLQKAQEVVREKIPEIEKIARKEINEEGKNYGVNAKLGVFPFPTKWYGDFALPAGKYKALKVVLGNGSGKNWWCVLFPPLCFVDVSNNLEENPENIEKVMQKIENKKLDKEEKEVKIKFKLLEIFK